MKFNYNVQLMSFKQFVVKKKTGITYMIYEQYIIEIDM